MVTRLGMDYGSKFALFTIGSASDVSNLPTMTAYGKAEATTFEPVSPGSYATVNDGSGDRYVLHDTNEWVKEA